MALPRPPSIFDEGPLASVAPTGAPPPLGKGNGQLFLVVRSLPMPNGSDLGPAVLLIKETRPKDPHTHLKWGPPGGETDKTDHSPLHAGLREFGEEMGGADWRNLANAAGLFQIARLDDQPKKNEPWMMLVNLDANQAENALFGEDRSSWNLSRRMSTRLSKETVGYAFVPLAAILNMDRSGNFQLGQHTEQLRYARLTMGEAVKIMARLKQLP